MSKMKTKNPADAVKAVEWERKKYRKRDILFVDELAYANDSERGIAWIIVLGIILWVVFVVPCVDSVTGTRLSLPNDDGFLLILLSEDFFLSSCLDFKCCCSCCFDQTNGSDRGAEGDDDDLDLVEVGTGRAGAGAGTLEPVSKLRRFVFKS